MNNIDARVKVETGKYIEACQSFVDYYDSKSEEISEIHKEYRKAEWDYVAQFRYHIPTFGDIIMFSKYKNSHDYLKMLQSSLDGTIEFSNNDIDFFYRLDNADIDIGIQYMKNEIVRFKDRSEKEKDRKKREEEWYEKMYREQNEIKEQRNKEKLEAKEDSTFAAALGIGLLIAIFAVIIFA